MAEDLLPKLMAAGSDEEREWIVMQFSLNNLAPELQEAVWAAAIPHWFDVNFLAALLDKTEAETQPLFEQLRTLSYIEPFQHRGYNVHERSRSLLLRKLWEDDQPRYRELARRAADYCAEQDQSDTGWRIEYVYHLLIADMDEGVNEYQNTGWKWHNSPNFAYAKVEAMALVMRELANGNRLSDRALAWTQFWEGLLDSDYSRYPSAKSKFSQIKISPSEDMNLTANIGLWLGRVLAVLSENEQARWQYQAALPLYQQIGDRLGEANSIKELGDIHRILSEFEQARRQYEAALTLYQQTSNKTGEAASRLGLIACYRNLGLTAEAKQQIELARESVANDSLYNRACFAALCGEVDEALTLLRSALEKREVNLEWARKDPDFDWIRDDPRFEQLLAEIAAKQR